MVYHYCNITLDTYINKGISEIQLFEYVNTDISNLEKLVNITYNVMERNKVQSTKEDIKKAMVDLIMDRYFYVLDLPKVSS